MREKNGMDHTGSGKAPLRFWWVSSTWNMMNWVTAVQKATMTMPTMIWFAWYRRDMTARTQPRRAPKTPATTTPTSSEIPVPFMALTTMTDDIAPIMNWPSMAMLTTPDRSHNVPDSDPKMRNVAAATFLIF